MIKELENKGNSVIVGKLNEITRRVNDLDERVKELERRVKP